MVFFSFELASVTTCTITSTHACSQACASHFLPYLHAGVASLPFLVGFECVCVCVRVHTQKTHVFLYNAAIFFLSFNNTLLAVMVFGINLIVFLKLCLNRNHLNLSTKMIRLLHMFLISMFFCRPLFYIL